MASIGGMGENIFDQGDGPDSVDGMQCQGHQNFRRQVGGHPSVGLMKKSHG